MRFSETAYEKCFPKQTPKVVVESAVETFKPTEQPIAEEDEVIEDEVIEETTAGSTEEIEEVDNGNIEDSSRLD